MCFMSDRRRIKMNPLGNKWDGGHGKAFSADLPVHMGEIVGGGVLCG